MGLTCAGQAASLPIWRRRSQELLVNFRRQFATVLRILEINSSPRVGLETLAGIEKRVAWNGLPLPLVPLG